MIRYLHKVWLEFEKQRKRDAFTWLFMLWYGLAPFYFLYFTDYRLGLMEKIFFAVAVVLILDKFTRPMGEE